MATFVKSFAIQGIDAYPVDIETKTISTTLVPDPIKFLC